MNKHLKKLRYRIYIASGVVLLVLTFAIWLFSNAFFSVRVNPKESVVKVDGEEIPINSIGIAKKRLPLGSHLVSVEADSYVSYFKTMSFKRGVSSRKTISLKQTPEASLIASYGQFIASGNKENEFYFLGDEGSRIYRANIELKDGAVSTTKTALTRPELYGIEDIIWSPKKDLALFRKSDGIYLFDFNKYDFVNQTEKLFGENIGSIAWAPDSSKIAYYYASGSGEQSLIFSSIDGKSRERILNLADLGISNPTIKWTTDPEWLALIAHNQERSKDKIYLLNAYTKEINPLNDSGFISNAFLEPDSQKVFFLKEERKGLPIVTIGLRDNKDYLSELNISGQVHQIAFLNDPNQILVSSNEGGREKVYKFDLIGNNKTSFSITLPSNNKVDALYTASNNKIIVYKTSEGIFAINTEGFFNQ